MGSSKSNNLHDHADNMLTQYQSLGRILEKGRLNRGWLENNGRASGPDCPGVSSCFHGLDIFEFRTAEHIVFPVSERWLPAAGNSPIITGVVHGAIAILLPEKELHQVQRFFRCRQTPIVIASQSQVRDILPGLIYGGKYPALGHLPHPAGLSLLTNFRALNAKQSIHARAGDA